jgi:pimeloyl-ACP methyl ester carboxylesterase
VTVGELDLVLPPRFSRDLVERIPGARLVVVPEAGHQPFQELPEDYNQILIEFWQSLG